MAQVAQGGTGRNTKISRPVKARNWTFTLNNYTQEDIKSICDSKYQYIFQEEKGSQGTPHLQGLLSSTNAISFNSVKKLLPKAHIEVCKNKIASIQYCQKNSTRVGKIFTNVDSWTNGTEIGTALDPRKLDKSEFQKFIELQVEETMLEDDGVCWGRWA